MLRSAPLRPRQIVTAAVDDHDDDDGDEGAEGDDDGEQDDGWPGDYKNFDNESSADFAI